MTIADDERVVFLAIWSDFEEFFLSCSFSSPSLGRTSLITKQAAINLPSGHFALRSKGEALAVAILFAKHALPAALSSWLPDKF